MRILLSAFPAFGHLHPVVPLALAAQNAGHEVRLATGANVVAWARGCGLDAYAVGYREGEAVDIAERDHPGPASSDHIFTDVWVPAALDDMLDITTSWVPDLVVHEEEEYAGVLLAAMRGSRCVTQSWAAPARPEPSRRSAARALGPIWGRYLPGSAPRRVGERYLDACPPPLQTPDLADIARDARVIAVRPGLFDGPLAPRPEFLHDLARPAAYVTLGTVAVFSTPELLDRIAAALAPQFASVIVTSGPNPIEALGPQPANVHVVPYVAQSVVLANVDLVVSHAGAGGTVGALAHGLAHLMLPGRGQSQITLAEAVHRAGAGLRLADSERGPADIARAALRLSSESRFANAARAIRAQLDELPGPREVLAMLEPATW